MRQKGFAPIAILLVAFFIIGISAITFSASNNLPTQTATPQPSVVYQTTQPTPVTQTAKPTSTPTPQSQVGRYIAPSISKTSNCKENNGLPDSSCTPGATDNRVTQANINSTICVSGYTSTVRPSTSYTTPLKIKQIQQYGYTDTSTSSYEEDHLIALELGGSPSDPANLWPEPYNITYNARQKDKVENYLHSLVCGGTMTLVEAQKAIAQNWESVFNNHYGILTPANTTTTAPVIIPITPTSTPLSNNSGGSWVCDCSKTCTTISSCQEAQYLLNICGCSARDGDKDGIACDGAPLNCQN